MRKYCETYVWPEVPFYNTYGGTCAPGHELADCEVVNRPNHGEENCDRLLKPQQGPDCTCLVAYSAGGIFGTEDATCDIRITQRRACDPIETCNGVDDDGDGLVDNGIACHDVKLIMSNIDDNGYLWAGSLGTIFNRICEANYSRGGYVECDLTALAIGFGLDMQNAMFVFELQNWGHGDTHGDFFLMIDGEHHPLSSQGSPTLPIHSQTVHRHYFFLDLTRGTPPVTPHPFPCDDPAVCPNPHPCIFPFDCVH